MTLSRQLKMWCVLTEKHGKTGRPYIVESTLSFYKSESIKKFVSGSSHNWPYWKRKFNFQCKRVTVTITTIAPAPEPSSDDWYANPGNSGKVDF